MSNSILLRPGDKIPCIKTFQLGLKMPVYAIEGKDYEVVHASEVGITYVTESGKRETEMWDTMLMYFKLPEQAYTLAIGSDMTMRQFMTTAIGDIILGVHRQMFDPVRNIDSGATADLLNHQYDTIFKSRYNKHNAAKYDGMWCAFCMLVRDFGVMQINYIHSWLKHDILQPPEFDLFIGRDKATILNFYCWLRLFEDVRD